MESHGGVSAERLGEWVGYASSYILFTTVLFFVLVLTGRIPQTWSYIHIMGISAAISLAGVVLRRVLE
jgi:hypothetical protein